MNHKNPDDYVLSTGIDHSVREIIELCLHKLNRNIKWIGSKDQEVGIITGDGSYSIKIDKTLYRPSEVPLLKGDYNKIYHELGWCPKMNFSELIDWMISEDIKKYDYSKH
jgi:GDPmannose 4,6-dehydratase